MKPKRTYKDSLFRSIFNNKKRLASLYKALTGETIHPKDIRITTLRGVFYNDIKNDISFRIGDRDIILMEHQSSWNPNMPLRMLWYLSKLYTRELDNREIIYRDSQVELPAPEFYVFYNGNKERPAHEILRLSKAFKKKTTSLELLVNCYNINYGTSNEILNHCYELRCYSIFVQKVRDGIQNGLELGNAIRQAISYCKTHDILAEYFQKNESEVFDMVNFKWDQRRAIEIAKEDSYANGKEEGKEEGIVIGEHNAAVKFALFLLKKGCEVKDVVEATNLSLEEIRKIADDNNLVCP